MSQTYPASRNQIERVITAARVALAASGLFAVWLDPAEPARYTALTYGLHAVYVFYAIVLMMLVWTRLTGPALALVTHVVDIILSAIFQYLTFGPSSPFFVYFIFSLFCGALRWGWQGTLRTAVVVVVAYVGMAASMSHTMVPIEFEINRFIIRVVYLVVSAALLVYLGQYEERLRLEIERLARWPNPRSGDMEATILAHLEHAAGIVNAGRALVVWERIEEPTVYLAAWPGGPPAVSRHAPGTFAPLVAAHLVESTFVSSGDARSPAEWIVSDDAGLHTDTRPASIHAMVARHIERSTVASAPFHAGQVSGRVFFSNLGSPALEIVPLTEVVAREFGASLDRLHLARQLQKIAAGEERIRVARDLHDGVLQSLTGIRLEIRSMAGMGGDVDAIRDRLFAMERAIASEQRELRLFIDDLGPHSTPHEATPLASRLLALKQRIALQWKAPVSISVSEGIASLPSHVEQAVPLMVHEAIVNALKHGQPSRISVTVDGSDSELRIVVTDDGRGFPFKGRHDHASLVEQRTGPRSLVDRVAELGGAISIDSSDTGARVEMVLTL